MPPKCHNVTEKDDICGSQRDTSGHEKSVGVRCPKKSMLMHWPLKEVQWILRN
jgi:hypothetical protein